MITLYDIHTHHKHSEHKAIISVLPSQYIPIQDVYYSIGIHPWNSDNYQKDDIDLLQQYIQHHNVVAVGETGIDRKRGACIEQQVILLEKHIALSEQFKKPLILHVVHGIDIILNMHNKYKPSQQWIIHGYRGNPITTRQLLNKNIQQSFNHKFNIESVKITPIEKLWIESDENPELLEENYRKIALIKNLSVDELKLSTQLRAEKLFFQS